MGEFCTSSPPGQKQVFTMMFKQYIDLEQLKVFSSCVLFRTYYI